MVKNNKVKNPTVSEFEKLTLELNLIDMKRAEIIKKLNEVPEYVKKIIQAEINKIKGRFYEHTANRNMFYKVLGGDVEIGVQYGKSVYSVSIDIENYDTLNGSIKSTSKNSITDTLPKNVRNFITNGNIEIDSEKAIETLNKIKEIKKKVLEDEITTLNRQIAEKKKEMLNIK